MRHITATEAKKHLLEMVRDADESFERYCITRNGNPKAVLLSVDDFEGWLETLELVSDQTAMVEIRKARKELDAGKGIPLAEVAKLLK